MKFLNNKKKIRIALAVITACLFLIVLAFNYYRAVKNADTKDQDVSAIPQQVMNRYAMLSSEFPEPLFIGISVCNSDQGLIYVSEVSAGYTGMRYFYSEDGIEIGSDIISDIVSDIPTENTRSGIQTFDCKQVY